MQSVDQLVVVQSIEQSDCDCGPIVIANSGDRGGGGGCDLHTVEIDWVQNKRIRIQLALVMMQHCN